MTSSINIEYNNSALHFGKTYYKSKETKGFDIKKEITNFNSKMENMRRLNKFELRQQCEEQQLIVGDLEHNFLDAPPEHNMFTSSAKFVKNKVMVLRVNNNGNRDASRDNSSNFSAMHPAKGKGVVYKTHILRNKLSNSTSALEKLIRKSIHESDDRKGLKDKTESDFNPEPQDSMAIDKVEQPAHKPFNPVSIKSNNFTFANASLKSPSTIYKVLMNRTNQIFDCIKKQTHRNYTNIHTEKPEESQLQKRLFFRNNNMTHYMEKHGDEVPYVFPVAWIHQNSYNNYSEQNRYEKITEMLLKLRYYIDKDEENEKKYLKEFMMKHGIYDEEAYSIDKLTNFTNFLRSNAKINPGKNMKQIIMDATNFNLEEGAEIISNAHVSYKARRIIHYTLINKRKCINKEVEGEDDRYNMNSYLSKPQPILEDRKFKFDINNPKSVIEGLEEEFTKLRNGFAGLNFNLNDSEVGRESIKKHKTNDKEKRENKHKQLGSTIKLSLKPVNSSQKMESKSTGKNVKLPKVKKELDFDQIKKKNKLLEFIVLQRSKSKYQLQQDMKRFKISEL